MVSPVSIGGVGGSGTRLFAQILCRLGWYLGNDLNPSFDNLWFTLLFKRTELWPCDGRDRDFMLAVETFRAAMTGDRRLTAEEEAWLHGLTTDRLQHDRAWLQQRVDSLLAATRTRVGRPPQWGWKEPNTHVLVDRLAGAFPEMRYIHVVRNGLDMAYSANQNQLRFWGPLFLRAVPETGPRAALKYWCAAQRRAARIEAQMPGRFLMVSYDAFCREPEEQLDALLSFLGIRLESAAAASLLALVRAPGSVGRFKQQGIGAFDADDVEYVRQSGLVVDTEDREGRSRGRQ